MYLYSVHAWYPQKSERASDTLVLELWMLVSLRVSGCWELNPGPELNKWPSLLGISAAPGLVFDWELRSNLWKLQQVMLLRLGRRIPLNKTIT